MVLLTKTTGSLNYKINVTKYDSVALLGVLEVKTALKKLAITQQSMTNNFATCTSKKARTKIPWLEISKSLKTAVIGIKAVHCVDELSHPHDMVQEC